MKVVGLIFWVAGVVLIFLMANANVDEVRTFKNTAIKSEKIIVGQNSTVDAKDDVSLISFLGREYDFVMFDKSNRYGDEIIFFGEDKKEYYRAVETMPTGFMQEIKEVRINGNNTEIILGKGAGYVVFLSIIVAVIFGMFGFLFFSSD